MAYVWQPSILSIDGMSTSRIANLCTSQAQLWFHGRRRVWLTASIIHVRYVRSALTVHNGQASSRNPRATVQWAGCTGPARIMPRDLISDDIRRFILTSVVSVPYLEAMLLLRNDSQRTWDANGVAGRLYISEQRAVELLQQLVASGTIRLIDPDEMAYRYSPVSEELRDLISRLAAIYGKELIAVTQLIHSRPGTQAQHFADAFRFRKDQ